jgi:hypothetical protein
MQSIAKYLPRLCISTTILLAVAIAPLRADNDTMAQPSQPVQLSHLHYLSDDKHDAIIAEARNIGWHRVEIARHYPTEIYAGRVLARAIVRRMNKSHKFQRDLAAVRAEVAAAQKAANN